MFNAARWRSEKNRIKAVFKFQFRATKVPPIGWESMKVTLVPIDVGKPSITSEKAAIVDGECQWLNPIYETVKFTQDPKNGEINHKVYKFTVSAPGIVKSKVLGEININLADYAEIFKPTTVSLPLQGSNNGAALHVTIQRGDVDGRKMDENGEIMKETIENRGKTAKPLQRTLQSQLSKPENEEAESAANRENDIISAKDGSFMKLNSNKNMPLRDDSSVNLRKSCSFDGISASGSESSSGQYTPKENGIKKKNSAHQENASSLSLFGTNDTPQNTDWTLSSVLDTNNAGSTNSSGSENTLKKQKSDLDTLEKQLIVSDLELQTLRKQVVKERRRGQDLSKEISSLIEERDALRKECEELKASKKRADHVENISAMLQLEAKDPRSILEKMKDELDHEKNLNATLLLQLQKTQESNSELIFAVRDLEEMLEQKNREMPCTHKDFQEMECQNQLLHLRNSENRQQSFETASDHEDEQCRLDVLMKEREERVVCSQEKKIRYLHSELELYKKDREDLEMQMEQIALDYEILKQENHYTSSRLEQIQLREQLRMQCECPTHSTIINDLESHIESLEKELQKQADAYEDNLATIIQDKVEQEQRAIQAEEELRKTKWKNANTVEQLQNEFKRLSSKLSNTFYANEELVMKTLEESRELHLENCHLRALLDQNTNELSSVQTQHQVKCWQLLSLIDFKTKEVDRLQLEHRDKREELGHQKKSEEARRNASIEEMTTLKAEMDQLAGEKSHLYGQVEQKADIERLNASTKEIERLLQENNLEKDQLGKELSVLTKEAKRTSEELNSLRHLKAEQDETIKALNSKVETITAQYTDLKHSLSGDELEKESLRKQVCLLRGDLRKEADIIANMEKRLMHNNAKLTISEGTKMANIRNKSKRTFQASHSPKMVASLQGNSKPSNVNHINGINENMHEDQQKIYYEFEDFGPLNVAHSQDDRTKSLQNYNTNGIDINEDHL